MNKEELEKRWFEVVRQNYGSYIFIPKSDLEKVGEDFGSLIFRIKPFGTEDKEEK